MKHQYFPSRLSLFKYLDAIVDDLDFDKTLRLPNLWFSSKDVDYKCVGTTEFCNKFNEVFKTKLDPVKSYSRGKRTVLFFDEIDDVQPEEEEVITEDIEEEQPLIKSTPDWEWINTLDNSKESKLLLDQYAEGKFSIKLNRNKKLDNMIADFKSELNL